MQDCPKCGKKIKTLYERHGAKATYEAMGYYCKRCGILYDKNVKKCASVPNTLTIGAAQAVNGCEQDRERLTVEPLTVTSNDAKWSSSSDRVREWMGRDSNSRPPACKAGILTRLDYPSS